MRSLLLTKNGQFEYDGLRKDFNKINEEVAKLKISGGDASEVIRSTEENQKLTAEKETEVQEARAAAYSKLEIIGNLVHDSVPVDNGEKRYKGAGVKGVHCIANSILHEERYHGKVCSAQFVEELYKIAGYLSCFRKEAGSHGRDTLGIFRVHQFEEVELFCLTSPSGNDSWDMHEEMITNSEEFYKMLKLPYQIVAIVSSALNDTAAKKYDLGGWFPASSTYRELVSCSNCTDFYNEQAKQVVHLLNSTLTATERTMCCILENYQREDGVEIPEVLREYMGGKTFLPFQIAPVKEAKGKKIKGLIPEKFYFHIPR
ncbi:unnamed protein product [Camellia sinensis]